MSTAAGKALRCLDCGKCTSACPVARYNRGLSPRRLVRRLIEGREGGDSGDVWACLTCLLCDARCPQEVPITGTMPSLRRQARERGETPAPTRCSVIDSIAVLQSRADLPQRRLDWLAAASGLRTDPDSKVLLWIGCTPYFDAFFAANGARTLNAVESAIRILNALDIAPAVRADERCCGHDQLWSGDEQTFERLANMNRRLFAAAAPELVVTVCPECQLTLSRDYQQRWGLPACRIVHVAELVAERAADLPLAAREQVVTYADPCRLGRHQRKVEEPRRALAAVPGLTLNELPRHGSSATCCAGNWLACNRATKRIQLDLLRDAIATGADLLVTACPKCLIHLTCAQSGGDASVADLEIRDLATVVAGALETCAATGRVEERR